MSIDWANTEYVAVPPGPRCARCGHVMCPCCGSWCDTLLTDEDGDYGDMCCEGECDVNPEAVAHWREQVDLVVEAYPEAALEVGQGPVQP